MKKILILILSSAFLFSCWSNNGTGTADTDSDTDADTDTECNFPDVTSGAIKDCDISVLEPVGSAERLVMDFKHESESLFVRIVRQPIEMSMDFGQELKAFVLEQDGELTCVTDECALTYNYSHHNWFDEVIGHAAETDHYLSLTFQPEGDPVTTPWVWTFKFWSTDKQGNEIIKSVELDMTACKSLPSNSDCMSAFE